VQLRTQRLGLHADREEACVALCFLYPFLLSPLRCCCFFHLARFMFPLCAASLCLYVLFFYLSCGVLR
jgi:hypothetical protein